MDYKSIMNVEMFPYIDACHYSLMSIAVREDAPQSGIFAKNQPFSCWIATLLMCFAGNIISSFLLSEPILNPLQDIRSIILATSCWYIINFSPYDIAYRFCSVTPIRVSICLIKEFRRTHKIYHGILTVRKKYENDFLIWIIIGTLKGSGSSIMRTLIALLIHSESNSSSGIKMPLTSKAALSVSILFTTQIYFDNSFSKEKIYLIGLIFLLYFRLTILLFSFTDPFVVIENVFCGLFFGHTTETIYRILRRVSGFFYSLFQKNNVQGPSDLNLHSNIGKQE